MKQIFKRKTNNMKKILGIIMVCAGLFSCQKEETIADEPSLTDFAQMKGALINTDWVLKHTALIYSPDLVDNGEVESCKKDDTYKFKLNGNADVEFGSIDCYMPYASGTYGTWDLQGTILKQTITRDVPGFINGEIIFWTVDYITQNKLRIKRVITEPGKTFTQMDTYIRR
jgi:Lipocalin-like domain